MNRTDNILIAIFLFSGLCCNKFVDNGLPKTELIPDIVFTEDKTATAAVVGIYSDMYAYNYFFANVLVNYLPAMSADELYYYASFDAFDVFRNNALLPASQYVLTMWSQPYSYIYSANSCIEGLTTSATLTPSVRDQLLGESYFIRALMHFYLVNLYGNVPLITTTNYEENNLRPRDTAMVVYDTIIADLKKAKTLLQDDYPTGSRVRPNKAAATALLARTYLYTKQWELAEAEATEVLENERYDLLADPNQVFLANSREAIWQLQPVNTAGRNTWEGFTSTPATPTSTYIYRLDSNLYKAFEPGDLRREDWTLTNALPAGRVYGLYKYKVRFDAAAPVTEYSMVLRYAEQFLIRGEARAHLNKLADSRADIDSIRLRAHLSSLPVSMTQGQLLLEVETQRHLELFCEWGHRWLDLKRTGRSTAVLGPLKPNWQPSDTLYPIPADAIKTNPALTQNNGYIR